MNSIHDMGGMDGWGPVRPEPNEPPFHEQWEGRVLAMQRAMGYARLWTIDESRASIEAMKYSFLRLYGRSSTASLETLTNRVDRLDAGYCGYG